MEIQASRAAARIDDHGAPVLLLEQNRARWDQRLICRGLAALDRADTLGGTRGPYALPAAIAACHARARSADQTDWPRIPALYDELAHLTPPPVLQPHRSVAMSIAFVPAAGPELDDHTGDD